jgi:hypothetical protein
MSEKLDFDKFTKEEVTAVIGPGSDSRKAAEMAKHRPELYAALKQSACYTHGVIAEAMLPRASQLTREQLDSKRRADAAAQRDDLIAIPDALAARLAVPVGTKVSYEALQKLMGRVHD